MADEVKSRSLEEISAFISQSVCEMEKLLHKLDWSKDKLLEAVNSEKMVQCPLNRAHRVPLLRLGKHVNDCKFKSLGLEPQDSWNDSEFFYQTSKAVISVFVENSAALGQGNDQVQGKESKDEAYCFDEMRSIMSWDIVPASHTKLQLEVLPQQKIRDWIIKNVPQVQYLSSVEGSCDRLVNFVLSCLQEDKVAHPDGMEKMLKDLLGNETRTFVLNLWKFLAVSIAEENHQARIDKANEQVDVPMERAVSDLTPQQRLAVYEHVVEVSKARREVKSENIDAEVETKSTDTTADGQGQPKSRYELLAEQRDYKRRRQSYRAKNVHITKRSAVEVMRDLIETQMNVLEMQLKNERGGSANNSDEEDAVSSEGRRSRGSRAEDEESTTARRDSRDEGRKKQREGHKRVSYYDETDIEKKKWRR